jgi:hypothetical protein
MDQVEVEVLTIACHDTVRNQRPRVQRRRIQGHDTFFGRGGSPGHAGQLALLPGVGHVSWVEAPERFNRKGRECLRTAAGTQQDETNRPGA